MYLLSDCLLPFDNLGALLGNCIKICSSLPIAVIKVPPYKYLIV